MKGGITLDKESIEYLEDKVRLTDILKHKIEAHAKRYGIEPQICAWYRDWDDFCSDWGAIGYTRTEARRLFHGGIGEFMKLPNNSGIVRFVI